MTKTTEVHLALSQRLNAAVSEAIQARSPFPLTYVANCLLAENADAEQAAAAYVEKPPRHKARSARGGGDTAHGGERGAHAEAAGGRAAERSERSGLRSRRSARRAALRDRWWSSRRG